MKLSEYPRCPECGRVNRSGNICDRCAARLERERISHERDRRILDGFKYKPGCVCERFEGVDE